MLSELVKGLPADKLEQVFKAFVTTKTGKPWAEANRGPGVTFHFNLPAEKQLHPIAISQSMVA